jgi:hypothetical protein
MQIEQEMELLKKLLNHMITSKSLYSDEEIITVSRKLDKLICTQKRDKISGVTYLLRISS